ncbi:HYC_CC_PP family protein [Chitinophaga sp. RAB17]|uniref:HYC_CC_PP family protein n=1 Tax=Chitinophaga sp. RAB17 TaxID=3233049 RepID=UPI003F914C27
MKKFVTLILLFLYLGVSTGATVHVHYCMGKVSNWGWGHENKKHCDNCGIEKSSGKKCCKDEHKTFKITNDQQPSDSIFHTLSVLAMLPPQSGNGYRQPVQMIVNMQPQTHAPPILTPCPLYLRHCIFLI